MGTDSDVHELIIPVNRRPSVLRATVQALSLTPSARHVPVTPACAWAGLTGGEQDCKRTEDLLHSSLLRQSGHVPRPPNVRGSAAARIVH